MDWYVVIFGALYLLSCVVDVVSPDKYREHGKQRMTASDASIVGVALIRMSIMVPIVLWALGVI